MTRTPFFQIEYCRQIPPLHIFTISVSGVYFYYIRRKNTQRYFMTVYNTDFVVLFLDFNCKLNPIIDLFIYYSNIVMNCNALYI